MLRVADICIVGLVYTGAHSVLWVPAAPLGVSCSISMTIWHISSFCLPHLDFGGKRGLTSCCLSGRWLHEPNQPSACPACKADVVEQQVILF